MIGFFRAAPPALVAGLLVQTCEALFEAHGKGVIHRDLKPANLFCIPRANRRDDSQSRRLWDLEGHGCDVDDLGAGCDDDGQAIGSPSYMSPEQMKANRYCRSSHRIFGLWGSSCTRRSPDDSRFPANSTPNLPSVIRRTAPAERAAAGHPPGLDAVVFKCLEKNRDHRFAHAANLAFALATSRSTEIHLSSVPRPSTQSVVSQRGARAPQRWR